MAKESKEGLTVKKEENFSEWYTQIINKANLVDTRYGVQGFIIHRPWAFKILRRIYEYFEKEVEMDGHEPFLFPLVIKKENLEKEKEHAGFAPDVFWITKAGNEKLEEELALRPTGETQIYPMYSLWIRSHKDLPLKGYQSRICTYRNEKTTRPFFRGREFMFFETHDVFATHEEALKQVEKDLEISKKVIFDKCKIPFLFFKRPQWDKFKGAKDTFTPDTIMPDGRRLQMGSTHDLSQNFSKPFNIQFTNNKEAKEYGWQTCYGPGIWRLMGAIIGVHGDDKGLILPFDLAPIQIIIVPIIFADKDSKKLIEFCENLETKLKENYKVKFDDADETPGFKYNKWELMGVPLRIEVGPKELKNKSLSLILRTEGKRKQVRLNEIEKEIENASIKIDKDIEDKAKEYFKDNTRDANSLKDLKGLLKKYKGFVRIPFCSVEKDGEKCAEMIKAETEGANICGTLYLEEEKAKGRCVVCSKPAKHIVYVAKSY